MTKEEFNKYCREFSDYKIKPLKNGLFIMNESSGLDEYNPYDDANQMIEVFDKLWSNQKIVKSHKERAMFISFDNGIKKSMRDFIESTKEE